MVKKAKITLKTKLPNTGENVDFFHYANPAMTEKMSQEQIEAEMKKMLTEVRMDTPMGITGIIPSYSFEDKVDPFPFGNTLIDVSIPYCLHIPNGSEFKITLNDKGYEALITTQKQWTENSKGSSLTDFFAEEKHTFFQEGTILSPKLPHNPELGAFLRFTGKNVERTKDNTGYFRYTRLQIFIETNYSKTEIDSEKGHDKIKNEIQTKTYDIVNRLLDTYRYVTKEAYIERLNYITIFNVYFLEHNSGYYPVEMDIQGARMNRPNKEFEEIKLMLKTDRPIPLFELLALNAQSSFEKKNYILSLVSSFQALEVFIENFLIEKYKSTGLSESDIEIKLEETKWTKDRLKTSLNETIGKTLLDLDNGFTWNKWIALNDKVRNEVIHHGKELTEKETEEAIKINSQIIAWLKTVT